jgi:hypothetical protein
MGVSFGRGSTRENGSAKNARASELSPRRQP